jgi:hypothetical protein
MDSFVDGCARYCASRKSAPEWGDAKTITGDGQTRTSQTWDCSPWQQPTERANPDEETTNWRAVCGKTARTVRREGRNKVLSYPYRRVGRDDANPSFPNWFIDQETISIAARSWSIKDSAMTSLLSINNFRVVARVWLSVLRRMTFGG